MYYAWYLEIPAYYALMPTASEIQEFQNMTNASYMEKLIRIAESSYIPPTH